MSKHSFELINYSTRPGKAVERKMIASLLARLSAVHPIEEYHYIGFGSTYFHDFILFHRELGIKCLTSIEVVIESEDRFRFNKPFDCIELKMGLSRDVLPVLSWNKKTILWLDYDSKLSSLVLSDISTFCVNAQSGNLIMLTLNCHGGSYGKDRFERQCYLTDELGEDNIPYTLKNTAFSNQKIATTIKEITDSYIISTIRQVNIGKSDSDKLAYIPLINFKYKDGAPMITFGGIVLDASDTEKFSAVNYMDLDFYRPSGDFFNIKVPSITPKEMRFINSQLPNGVDEHGNFIDKDIIELLKPEIPPGDVKNYAKIYRFLPMFTENFSF